MPEKTSSVWLTIIFVGALAFPVYAQHHDAVPQHSATVAHWEGSPEGKAYSEFNHHLAGAFVILIGLSELVGALALAGFTLRALAWARFLLPVAMLAAGIYLLVWSDHDAWPIGTLSLTQTFFGGDLEILQHKVFGLLLCGIGLVETWRRLGKIRQLLWAAPLPVFAILGGILLFAHHHGDHPGANAIMINHMIMGTMAIAAGSSKLATSPVTACFLGRSWTMERHWGWYVVWPALILLIGLQLLLYRE
jgi:hypothetical protein